VVTAALFALDFDDGSADFRDDNVPNITTLGAHRFNISSNGSAHAAGYSRVEKKIVVSPQT